MTSGLPAFVLRYLMSRTWVFVLSLLGVAAVGIFTWVGLAHPSILSHLYLPSNSVGDRYAQDVCNVWGVRRGVNIDHATKLVATSGIAAVVAVAVVLKRRRLLTAVLLLETVALCIAIGLVAADSATYVADYDCSYSPHSAAFHVQWLFAALGVPLALLLFRAIGAWKGVEPPPRRFRTPRVWQTGA